MYAILKLGGKQYTVKKDTCIHVEKMPQRVGERVKINTIVATFCESEIQSNQATSKCVVEAEVIKHSMNRKVMVIKFNRRKHYKKTQGHRQ